MYFHEIMNLNMIELVTFSYPQVYMQRSKIFERKIATIFYLSVLTYVLGVQKNHLIETVLLSTTTYVLVEKKKIFFVTLNYLKAFYICIRT